VSSQVGYARISTSDQDPALQLDALAKAGCERVFTDRASGALDRRPELDQLLNYLRPDDVLVVWKLDRLGRNLRHLIGLIEDLNERGIGFRSLTEGFDTTTPSGKLLFSLIGAIGEFERSLIRERTRAGLEAARARGRKGGRPQLMTEEKQRLARQLYDSGEHSVSSIASVLGVSRRTLYRYLDPLQVKKAG